MRLVVARCTVEYHGRLESVLPEAIRLLMIKADGCVAIHADGGAYKPLNWMNAPNTIREQDGRWEITNSKGEALTVILHEVLSDTLHELGDDPGLSKDGVEAHLQELLAVAPHHIEEGLVTIRREHQTAIGPVDLLCRAVDGDIVAVEVKRRGDIDGVEQLCRYLEYLRQDPAFERVRGVFVAQSVKPQARTLAESRGLGWREVDYDVLRGAKEADLTLF